jgi:hypothetical protein
MVPNPIDYKYIASLFLGLIGVMFAVISMFAFNWLKFIHERLDRKADRTEVEKKAGLDDVLRLRDDSIRIWETLGRYSSDLNNAIETWRVEQEKARAAIVEARLLISEKMAADHAELLKAIAGKQDRNENGRGGGTQ